MSSQKHNRGFISLFILLAIPVVIVGIYLLSKNNSLSEQNTTSQITQTLPEPSITLTPDSEDAQFPSPNGKKIAYVETSPETIAREKEDRQKYGFVSSSTNVWISNADGQNKIQLTNHEDFVYREIIKWLDNDRLLFKDGESFLSIYSVSQKKVTDLLVSTEARQSCVDSCYGLFEYHDFSPEKTYYFNFYAGENDDIVEIANIKTLETFTIHNPYNKCVNNIEFTNDHILTFKGADNAPNLGECYKDKEVKIQVDLEKRKLTVQ